MKPTFSMIQPSQQTMIKDITCDEPGITCDESGYTADGLSGTQGNGPKGVSYNKIPGVDIN